MTDEELLDNALPWIEELLRRKMIGVQVRIPATAVTPEKIAHAYPDYAGHHVASEQVLLFVENWPTEEVADDLRRMFVANPPPKPRRNTVLKKKKKTRSRRRATFPL